MAKDFKTQESHKMLYYMLEHPRFGQRPMARDLGLHHNEKISGFVRWLEDLKFVRKTMETEKGKPRYEVPSRTALLSFYSRFRDMNKEKISTYSIGRDYDSVRKYLSDNGAIMCLTTALQLYDDYFRDPEIHVYVENPKLLEIIPEQHGGKIKVHLYEYYYPDITKTIDEIRATSPTRTIMDLYCSNKAYAAEQLIPKVWNI